MEILAKTGYVAQVTNIDLWDEVYDIIGISLADACIYPTAEEAFTAGKIYTLVNYGKWEMSPFWYNGDAPDKVDEFYMLFCEEHGDDVESKIEDFIEWCEDEGIEWNKYLDMIHVKEMYHVQFCGLVAELNSPVMLSVSCLT